MKNIITSSLFILFLFAACTKDSSTIQTPPPVLIDPSNPPDTIFSISAFVNGTYVTFNNTKSADTTYPGQIAIMGWCDSVPFINYELAMGFTASDNIFVPGLYPYYAGTGTYSGGYTLYTYINDFHIGFQSYDDSSRITNVTDSTISGTFQGACHGQIYDGHGQISNPDSVIWITKGQFHLRKVSTFN